jgi:hypothetical protein
MTNRKQYPAMLAMAVGAGLRGGVGLDRLSTAGDPVLAEQMSQPAEVIRAERVELVARDGTRRAALGLGSEGEPALEFYDPGGNLDAAPASEICTDLSS